MTALKEYQRLEATGLWRATPEDQRREVVVSIGEATLTISDLTDRALAHWSLAAVMRIGSDLPAVYHPDGDTGETLELDESESDVIDALEKLRSAIERSRPRPGRLRLMGGLSITVAIVALILFWLPGALLRHTVSVVPTSKRAEIGDAILGRIERVAGQACVTDDAAPILDGLARRTGMRKLVVLDTGVQTSAVLPGGIVLLNKSLIEDFEDPAILAGYVLTEHARTQQTDPLNELLSFSGPVATFRLLTTGEMTPDTIDLYAEHVTLEPWILPPDDALLQAFEQARISTRPFAYAVDITGETVLGLVEADPMVGKRQDPVMPDRDWVLLQNICGG